MTVRLLALAAIATLIVTLTGCFSTVPPAQQEATDATEELPTDCLTVTDGALTKLAAKIANTVPGAEVLRHGLTASDDLWFLAVEYTDPGLNRDFTGVWGSMQDLTADEDPAFVAVDEVAEASAEYLQPVDFDKIGAALPDAVAAVDCLA